MSHPLRIAMIGAGAMANQVHYPSLAAFADVEIAAICDLDPTRLQNTADKYHVTGRYTDYRQMIETVAPDAVYAIGQPHLMFDIWLWCLQQGLNLCIEKPMGITLHQAQLLAYLADKHNCITQVSFQRRASPLAVKLHTACVARGAITHASCTFTKWLPGPFLNARDHMLDDSVHAIDTLRWLCGGEIVEIQSHCKRVGTPDINFIAAMLHFDSGATGLLLNSWTSGRRIFKVEMHSQGICAESELEVDGVLYADGDTKGTRYDARTVAGGDAFHIYGGFQAKNREFIDAIKSGTQPTSHFGDALKTMVVAEKILAHALLTA